MDPTKKRKQPDSAFDEDPNSGDGAVSNWREGDFQDLRLNNRNAIEDGIQKSHNAETPVIKATAERVEGWFYKEATSEDDYKTRVSDYMQRIPHTPGILQAALVDFSQMRHLDNPQEQPMAGLPSEGSTSLPPDQQQPQQQQSGPSEHQKELVEEVGDVFYNI